MEVIIIILKYSHIYKNTNLPKWVISELLTDKDFIAQLDGIVSNTEIPDDSKMYEAIKNVLFPMLIEVGKIDDFKHKYIEMYGTDIYKEWKKRFRFYKKAIKWFSKILYGENRFMSDYELYRKQYQENAVT